MELGTRIFLLAILLVNTMAFASDHEANAKIDPDTALRYLKNGNKRFLEPKKLRKDGQGAEDVARLSKGQNPHTIVVACSDSRVSPEILFDQKLGEVFVVRVAGEAIDSSVLASVEYAAEHLGSSLVVVMGHTECGAVKAALSTKPGTSAGSKSLDQLVADIRPRIVSTGTVDRAPSAHVEKESSANARGVARDLEGRSSVLKHLVEKGKLKIIPSLYHLESGQVEFFER